MKSIGVVAAACVALVLVAMSSGSAQSDGPVATAPGEVVGRYCLRCHNDRTKSGGMTLAHLDFDRIEATPELAEGIVYKLRAGLMPPPDARRPAAGTLDGLASALETALDASAAANPNPGRPSLHRLNRFEYANSIRDVVGLEIDAASLLPVDDSSHGFDNMSEVLTVSPTLTEAYVRAAGHISRAALGAPGLSPVVETYRVPQAISQLEHVEGAPFGTRGGLVFRHNFPMDGEYAFRMTFYYASIGPVFGASQLKGVQKLEVAIDGARVALLDFDPKMTVSDDLRTSPIPITAGPKTVSVAFLETSLGPVEDFVMPFEQALADLSTGHIAGLTGLPHLRDVGVGGPYSASGFTETPVSQKILSCRPRDAADEPRCARRILTKLARQAFRRPATSADLERLMKVYEFGRTDGDFRSGIRMALQAIIADPQFVFRFERTPPDVMPGSNFRISDLELASRLSYFLWSSAPDNELITVAATGRLREPNELERQARRMLADPRSEALAASFATQWLGLRNLDDLRPDVYLFPDWDMNLTRSMRRETELFFQSIVWEDRRVLELLTGEYTFIDGRLARHYGIPNITGNRFRRTQLVDPERFGLLGQASILTATSMPNRTSPVLRGRWVLEQIFGVEAPTPPPNVPDFPENTEDQKALSVRERLEQHRSMESCAACHRFIDPLGFPLEVFDAVGARRIHDSGSPIEASGELYDGTMISGPVGLRRAIVERSDLFVQNLTEKLLTYALGRGLEHYDMPTVRSIARSGAAVDIRFSTLVLGIVKSVPFQMRRAEEAKATLTTVGQSH